MASGQPRGRPASAAALLKEVEGEKKIYVSEAWERRYRAGCAVRAPHPPPPPRNGRAKGQTWTTKHDRRGPPPPPHPHTQPALTLSTSRPSPLSLSLHTRTLIISTVWRQWDRRILPTYEDAVRALTGSFTVYVGNLSFFTSELQIHAAFTPCGPVRSVIMGLNRVTKSPCGFCFVEFFSHRAATDAVALLHGSKIEGRQIKVELDPGFTEGRRHGRGKTGGQVADHSRKGFDAGRGGWSVQSGERRARHGGGGWSGGRGGGHGGRRRGGRNNFRNGRGGGWQNQSGEARVLGVKRKHDEFRSYNPRFRDDHSDDERDDLDERDDRVPNQ